jgi:hypothetical protein
MSLILLLLFADGQKMICFAQHYKVVRNSKAMAYKRQVQMRSKIVTENTTWEQVNKFTNLQCEILILGEKDLTENK